MEEKFIFKTLTPEALSGVVCFVIQQGAFTVSKHVGNHSLLCSENGGRSQSKTSWGKQSGRQRVLRLGFFKDPQYLDTKINFHLVIEFFKSIFTSTVELQSLDLCPDSTRFQFTV